jgi:DNA-binding GntR family transcriptional regulator
VVMEDVAGCLHRATSEWRAIPLVLPMARRWRGMSFKKKQAARAVEANTILPSTAMEAVYQRKSSAIPRQSLAAAVVERLREKILSGELQEGQQLRQEAIATEFEISRIPVREALSHLAGEGLVKIIGNRGAVVAALSSDEIMQLFETRAVLEKYMLREAIPNITDEDLQRAEDILVRYEKSLEHDSEVKSWGRWNWSFHSALYAPANRAVMLSFLKTLNMQCDRYTRLHLIVTRDLHQAGKLTAISSMPVVVETQTQLRTPSGGILWMRANTFAN